MTQVDAVNQVGWGVQAFGPGYPTWTFSFTELHEDGSETPLVISSKAGAEDLLKNPKIPLDPKYEYRVYPVLKEDLK